MRHPKSISAAAALLASLHGASLATAATPDGNLVEHLAQRAWLQTYDPTLVASRMSADLSYESADDGDADMWKIENTIRKGIPLREHLALGLQMLIPLKWTETAADDAFGTGDVEVRAGIVGRISPTLRYGVALNAVLDSASDSLLSDNAFILRPITAIRWDVSDRVNLGMNIEYNVTPLDEEKDDVSALELKFPIALKINETWSAFASYNPRWNLLAETDRHRLEIGTNMTWGTHNQYAWTSGIEVPLTSESFDFKIATGIVWYF